MGHEDKIPIVGLRPARLLAERPKLISSLPVSILIRFGCGSAASHETTLGLQIQAFFRTAHASITLVHWCSSAIRRSGPPRGRRSSPRSTP
jgi:hypothetical protein